jgi:hypothetical protein
MGIISMIPLLVKPMLLDLTMAVDPHLIQFPMAIIGIGTNLQIQFNIDTHGLLLAQQFQNVDLIGNLQTGWTDFLQTGKAGALTIGLVMGYVVRGITR